MQIVHRVLQVRWSDAETSRKRQCAIPCTIPDRRILLGVSRSILVWFWHQSCRKSCQRRVLSCRKRGNYPRCCVNQRYCLSSQCLLKRLNKWRYVAQTNSDLDLADPDRTWFWFGRQVFRSSTTRHEQSLPRVYASHSSSLRVVRRTCRYVLL